MRTSAQLWISIRAASIALLCLSPLRAGPPCEKDVHLIFQAEPLGSSRGLFFGAEDEVAIAVPPDVARARHTVAAAISSNLPGPGGPGLCRGDACSGLGGWAISLGLEGDLDVVGATVEESNPAIICGGAFFAVNIIDPNRPGPDGRPQGKGVTSAFIFLCGDVVTLAPRGTETVLGVTVEAARPASGQSVSGKLRCHDGFLLPGGAPPTENIITVQGRSLPFCSCREIAVRFDAVDSAPFRRCDPDQNGRLEISDAVSFLDWLFRGGRAGACRPAADCNGDRSLNISDAVYALLFLFGGGTPPPAPFPDCGRSTDPSEICSDAAGACPP